MLLTYSPTCLFPDTHSCTDSSVPSHPLQFLPFRFEFCPSGGCEIRSCYFICLPTGEAEPWGPCGDDFVFPSQLAALKRQKRQSAIFWLMMSIFQEGSGEFPTEFIVNYCEDLGVTIGMTHL